MAKNNTNAREVKTARTIFGVIETLQRLEGATITEVATELDLAQSTVYQHLTTLEHLGYVVKHEGQYQVGLKFLDHGMFARNRYTIARNVKPPLQDLAETTGELVWLVVEEHGQAVFVKKFEGVRAISVRAREGTRGHLHYLDSGKAILAHLSEERVREIMVEHGLPQMTSRTITSESELLGELADVRERGTALMDGDVIEGLYGIAAPVLHRDEVLGAVSVSGPSHRLCNDGVREGIREDLLSATNEIELRLKSDL